MLFIFLFVVSTIVKVNGHGRLMDPPARNAMWRFGYKNPPNYNDNELFCGGFTVKNDINGGRCGVCGDDYRKPVPRDHEAGGRYANGIIVRTYAAGQQIPIHVELTANHKGWFEIKICPNNDVRKIVDQECLDRYPLRIVGQDTTKFHISPGSGYSGNFKWDVQLPPSMTCSQCVIQWVYNTGNFWGRCKDGREGLGCGPQETFINCADVEILPNSHQNHWFKPTRDQDLGDIVRVEEDHGIPADIPVHIPVQESKPLVIRSQVCVPVGSHDFEKMSEFCKINCLKNPPNCPKDRCKCVSNCEAIGEFAKIPSASMYCYQNCFANPPFCPQDRCKCT